MPFAYSIAYTCTHAIYACCLCNSYTMDTFGLPDIYTLIPREAAGKYKIFCPAKAFDPPTKRQHIVSYVAMEVFAIDYLVLTILCLLIILCMYLFITIVIVQVTSHPISMVVNINSTATLSCEATGSGPIRYQWRRVNGEISSDRAEGVNTSTLTISPVQQEDEDEYYCVASNGGVDGLQYYSDISHRAMMTLYGKVTTFGQSIY